MQSNRAEMERGNFALWNLKNSYLQLYFYGIWSRCTGQWRLVRHTGLPRCRRWTWGSCTKSQFRSRCRRHPFQPYYLCPWAACTPKLIGIWETARLWSCPPSEGLHSRARSHGHSLGSRWIRCTSCSRSTCRTACRCCSRRCPTRSIRPRYKSYRGHTEKKHQQSVKLLLIIIRIFKNFKEIMKMVLSYIYLKCSTRTQTTI